MSGRRGPGWAPYKILLDGDGYSGRECAVGAIGPAALLQKGVVGIKEYPPARLITGG
jgi:hypothetical protein